MEMTIKDKTFELKNSFRSYMIYENIQNKSFSPEKLTDILVFFYSTILASSKMMDFTWDEFLDFIDEKPEVVTEFSEWLARVNGVAEDLSAEQKKKGDGSKKK